MKKLNEKTMRSINGGAKFLCGYCGTIVNGVWNFIWKHRLGTR